MATVPHETHTHEAKPMDFGKLGPLAGFLALLLGVVTAIMFMTGDRHLMFGSYMYGLVFWLSVTLGCFGLSLLHHAVRGSWSVSILRLLEAGGGWASLLLMGVLFLPVVLFGMEDLYHWLHPGNDPILLHKVGYLNTGFWTLRLVFFFTVWIFWSWFMRKSTLRQDESRDFKLESGRSSWGAAGIVMFMVTVTFAFLDWVMSMDPHWYSTMYGVWLVVSSTYAALSLSTFILCSNANKTPYNTIIQPNLTKDLGNMMFTVTMLWGYTTLSQFLIIWNGNVPETTSYFATRSSAFHPPGMEANNWGLVGFILIIGMFFIPFYSLLAPRTKKTPGNLRKVAIWMFIMSTINMYLIVIPSLPGRAAKGPVTGATLTDLLAFAAIGAVWFLVFTLMAKRAPLLPLYDNRLQEAKKHAH